MALSAVINVGQRETTQETWQADRDFGSQPAADRRLAGVVFVHAVS
jgi:hypothetical protein